MQLDYGYNQGYYQHNKLDIDFQRQKHDIQVTR